MDTPLDLAAVTGALELAGCVAAEEEAADLIAAAEDEGTLRDMLRRRLTGEPFAWIVGTTRFCGLDIAVDPGVYVPRWQSEPLARRAAQLLPARGRAVDICTGTGALALVMQSTRPHAQVVVTEIDALAAKCARRNGLVVYEGHLDEPLPAALAGQVDVMTGVLPYVPREALHLLPRDVQHYEPRLALDGGEGGLAVLAELVGHSPRWLKAGGWLLLEAGGDQLSPLASMLAAAGFEDIDELSDEDGDTRGICGRFR